MDPIGVTETCIGMTCNLFKERYKMLALFRNKSKRHVTSLSNMIRALKEGRVSNTQIAYNTVVKARKYWELGTKHKLCITEKLNVKSKDYI